MKEKNRFHSICYNLHYNGDVMVIINFITQPFCEIAEPIPYSASAGLLTIPNPSLTIWIRLIRALNKELSIHTTSPIFQIPHPTLYPTPISILGADLARDKRPSRYWD